MIINENVRERERDHHFDKLKVLTLAGGLQDRPSTPHAGASQQRSGKASKGKKGENAKGDLSLAAGQLKLM